MRVCQFRHPGVDEAPKLRSAVEPVNGREPNPRLSARRTAQAMLRGSMARDTDTLRSIAQNRKARHRYEVLDELECGIVLVGSEVKSLRSGRGASIAEAFARIKHSELWLVGMHVPEYAQANRQNHEPVHDRKLLAHAREIDRWEKRMQEKGLTIVPLEIYFKGPRIKVRLGLCRGKKQFDKRETQKKRDAQRDIDRALTRRR